MPGGDAAARADILKGMIAVEKAAYGRDVAGAEPRRTSSSKRRCSAFPASPTRQTSAQWFAANDVGIFGVDLWASDWIKMTPDEELKLVMSRLEKNGHKGMLLMHDNHPWTAAMVPMLLEAPEGRRLQDRPHGRRRAGQRSDRPRAARLDFGDRARDRRAEAAAREGGGEAVRRAGRSR